MARLLEADVLPEIRGQYRAGDIRHCIANIDAATRALGFVPQVGFQDGMSGLTQWLAGQEATDLVDKAEQELARRDLTR
jgi:dTDP-L-rhamnose 4-epimerase